MTEQPARKTLNQGLIEQLYKLQEKAEALRAAGLPVPEPQSVLVPIPSTAIKDGSQEVCAFFANIGLLNRHPELGLPVKIEAGDPVDLNDGRNAVILEAIFSYTQETDIEAVETFLNSLEKTEE